MSSIEKNWIVDKSETILVTGAGGFIGIKVVEWLLQYGFKKVRCLIRSDRTRTIFKSVAGSTNADVEVIKGNLLSREDCDTAAKDAAVIYHLAVGPGGKSFPNSFMNTVIPTRNLLESALKGRTLKRFVNVSSFAVYSNQNKKIPTLLDETSLIDENPELRGDAYGFAKLKQDQIVIEYGKNYSMPYVIVRPGAVYGPGKDAITGRVGIDTFGFFLHLGGPNNIPFTYVDNCAEAIVLSGLIKGIDGEVFNIVDDDLPTSRAFLKMYKKKVKHFKSIYVPHALSYLLCFLWEKYSEVSKGQLPPIFSRNEWHAYWKKTSYSNEKLKARLGWEPKVQTEEGLERYFKSCSEKGANA